MTGQTRDSLHQNTTVSAHELARGGAVRCLPPLSRQFALNGTRNAGEAHLFQGCAIPLPGTTGPRPPGGQGCSDLAAPLLSCCYRRGSAAAARSRATDPATTRAEPAAILGLRGLTRWRTDPGDAPKDHVGVQRRGQAAVFQWLYT
jgi:hypothetical protein